MNKNERSLILNSTSRASSVLSSALTKVAIISRQDLSSAFASEWTGIRGFGTRLDGKFLACELAA